MVNRGWTYEGTTETDRSTNQGKQQIKEDRPRHSGDQTSSPKQMDGKKTPLPQDKDLEGSTQI